LFGGFVGTAGLSDFPRSCISGLRPWPSLSGPPRDQRHGRAWDLPVLAHGGSVHAWVLRPRGAFQQLAIALLEVLPSASGDGVGTPNKVISRLNSPAYTCTCQRFAPPLRTTTHDALSSPPPCRFIPAHLQFPRHPSDRSTSPTPEGPSPPAPRTQAASMAFAKSTQARHPHFPAHRRNPSRRCRLRFMLRTGQLLGPASTPVSQPKPGASLPGTLASPRTGLSPAG
jgi:hypothetical protein